MSEIQAFSSDFSHISNCLKNSYVLRVWYPYYFISYLQKPNKIITWVQYGTAMTCPSNWGKAAFKFGQIMLRHAPAEKKKTNLLKSSLVSGVSSLVKDKPKGSKKAKMYSIFLLLVGVGGLTFKTIQWMSEYRTSLDFRQYSWVQFPDNSDFRHFFLSEIRTP